MANPGKSFLASEERRGREEWEKNPFWKTVSTTVPSENFCVFWDTQKFLLEAKRKRESERKKDRLILSIIVIYILCLFKVTWENSWQIDINRGDGYYYFTQSINNLWGPLSQNDLVDLKKQQPYQCVLSFTAIWELLLRGKYTLFSTMSTRTLLFHRTICIWFICIVLHRICKPITLPMVFSYFW